MSRSVVMSGATAALGLAALMAPATATEFTIEKPAKPAIEYSPYINKSFPQRVFWGDTHLHTSYSPDAGMIGNFNLGPADAYRFARGEQVQANKGRPLPGWLSLDDSVPQITVLAMPTRDDVQIPVEEHLIVELCSM